MSEKTLIGRVVAFCLLLVPGCYYGAKYEVSEGQIDGTLRKVSNTGVFWKTWEVKINAGTEVAPTWHDYTVSDPEVVKKVRALPIGQRVRFSYRKYLCIWIPNGETGYRIVDVEVLK